MAKIDNQLQDVVTKLTNATNTLNTVLGEVQIGPGPTQDPAATTSVTSILASAQAIIGVANQIMAFVNPAGGPGSSIEVKKDVQYLDAAARARIAAETMGIKLATYKYKTDAEGREHLGFILEDSPNVPAADMGRKEVDLYAYASMVLATVQQQQQEIATLKAEVERLKKS
jgi:hypothetical protein